MSEAKPIASLSSVLLARKGAARPAMRRPAISGSALAEAVAQDDLGWNDMGWDVDPDPAAPMDYEHDSGYNPLAGAVPEVKPEVKLQQERIAAQLQLAPTLAPSASELPAVATPVTAAVKAEPSPSRKAAVRAAPGSKAKAAFTLRLNSDRHLQLRLACAVSNRSAQQLVTEALDAFLLSMPQVASLASQLPAQTQPNAD